MQNSRWWVLCLCLLVALTSSAAAQSGRKQKKADPQPPPQGINQPDKRVQSNDVSDAAGSSSSTDPEPEEDNGQKKIKGAQKRMVVMSSMPDMNVSLYFADIARQGCTSELHRIVPTLQVTEESNQNRSDAMRVAKDSDDTFVVLLEIESFSGTGMINGMDLRFTVFEPKTGKQIAFGSGMPNPPTRGVPVPIGASNAAVRMDWAARDVAYQIVSKLKLRPGF